MKTIKNKIGAVIILLISLVPVAIDNDITCLFLFGALAIYMFFAKEDLFYSK